MGFRGKDAPAQDVTVFRYGARSPHNWGPDMDRQQELARRLYNRCVRIERAAVAIMRQISADSDEVRRLTEQRDELVAERDHILARQKARNRAARKTADAAPIEKARLDAVRAVLKELTPRMKEALRENRERQKPALQALDQRRNAAITRARKLTAAAGCYWGLYNAVLAQFSAAAQRSRREGAELRYRRRGQVVQVVNQIQPRRQGMPGGMTPDELMTGARNEARVEVVDGRHVVHLTGAPTQRGVPRRYVSAEFIMHRPIPDEWRIKEIRLAKGDLNRSHPWQVIVTCTREAVPVAPAGRGRVAVDIGWRMMPNGLRVAVCHDGTDTWQVLLDSDGRPMRAPILSDWTRASMDRLTQETWDQARGFVADDLPDDVQAALTAIRRSPAVSWRLLNRLLSALSSRHQGAIEQVRATPLDPSRRWRPIDAGDDERALARNLAWWQRAHKVGRQNVRAHNAHGKDSRKKAYEELALQLAVEYAEIVLEKFDLRQTARKSESQTDQIRRNARTASVGMLRDLIARKAAEHGATVIWHEGISTWLCHACGHRSEPIDKAELRHTCPSCWTQWDQDENAAINLYRHERTSALAAAE